LLLLLLLLLLLVPGFFILHMIFLAITIVGIGQGTTVVVVVMDVGEEIEQVPYPCGNNIWWNTLLFAV
jgi:hypothetical protein